MAFAGHVPELFADGHGLSDFFIHTTTAKLKATQDIFRKTPHAFSDMAQAIAAVTFAPIRKMFKYQSFIVSRMFVPVERIR